MLKITRLVHSAGQISVNAIGSKQVQFTLINCCIGGGGDCFSPESGNK